MQRLLAGRRIDLTPDIQPVVEELYWRFREKFGREPKADDPVFFDPDADYPAPLPPEKVTKLWAQVVESWLSRGKISRDVAYAMTKTGLVVTEENAHLLSPAERNEWNEAVEEAQSRFTENSP